MELTQKNNFPEENATELVLKLKKASLCSKILLSKGPNMKVLVNGNQKFFEATLLTI
jgi:hypothetical protein